MSKITKEQLRLALEKDFNDLYVPEFKTNYRSQRLVRKLEIDVMSFKNTLKLLNNNKKV